MWFWKKYQKQASITSMPERLNVDEKALHSLCPALRRVLDAEIVAGNEVISANFADWPFQNGIVITLKRIFQLQNHKVSDSLNFETFDYHGIPESYFCKEHNQVVFATMPTLQQWKSGRLRTSYNK